MPAYVPGQAGVVAWLALWALVTALVYLCVMFPLLVAAFVIIMVVMWVLSNAEEERQKRIAGERTGDSICSFARAFDCRATDTWIVRAVFEEIAEFTQFPIRPEDRLEDDLKIDPEDIEDAATAIAQRTGRPLDECERNPLYGNVKTSNAWRPLPA